MDEPDPSVWRRTLDAIGEAVIATDLDGTVTLWNAAAEALYGWTAEEAVGTNIVDLTPSDASREQAMTIMEHLARGETFRDRFEVRRRDGTTFPALVTDTPLMDDAGNLVGIIGISVDLTEQLEAEAVARRARLQAAVAGLARTALDVLSLDVLFEQAVSDVSAVLSAPLVLIGEFTRSGDRVWPRAGIGWQSGVVAGPVIAAQRSAVADRPTVVEDYDDAASDVRSQILNAHGVRSGVTVAIGGRPGGFGLLAVYDTTARRFGEDQVAFVESVANLLGGAVVRTAVEDELRRLAAHIAEERRRYQELFDLAPDPYLVTDLAGVIKQANQQARVVLDAPRLEGTSLARFVSPGDTSFERRLRSVGDSTSTVRWDMTLLSPGGRQMMVQANVGRGVAANGTPSLWWVLHDVTEIHRTRQALQDAVARTREHVDHLRNVEAWKNAMLSAAAHDLRSPLSAITVAARAVLAADGLDAEAHRRLLDSIHRHANSAQSLLFSLLDLDRLTRGIVAVEREPCRLDQLVADAIEGAAVAAHPLVTELEQVDAMVDPTHFRQLVTNLVVNAAQHTPARTAIAVTLTAQDDAAVLTVEDDGPGLPTDLEDIFAPFTTAPRHDEDVAGTGIGLSLVKLFVELHEGIVHAENRPGGGASFTVELPGCVLGATDRASTTPDAPGARRDAPGR